MGSRRGSAPSERTVDTGRRSPNGEHSGVRDTLDGLRRPDTVVAERDRLVADVGR